MDLLSKQIIDIVRELAYNAKSGVEQCQLFGENTNEDSSAIHENINKADIRNLQDAKRIYTKTKSDIGQFNFCLRREAILKVFSQLEPVIFQAFDIAEHQEEIVAKEKKLSAVEVELLTKLKEMVKVNATSPSKSSADQSHDGSHAALSNDDDAKTETSEVPGTIRSSILVNGTMDVDEEKLQDQVHELAVKIGLSVDQESINSLIRNWESLTNTSPIAIVLSLAVADGRMCWRKAEKLAKDISKKSEKEASEQEAGGKSIINVLIKNVIRGIQKQEKRREREEREKTRE